MSEPLFFLNPLPAVGATAIVEADEAHHITAVRRQGVGDNISLFDGQGTIAQARILAIGARARTVAAQILQCEHRAAPTPLHLASALPKGERQATLLDLTTQLGMTAFTPLQCARSVAQAGAGAPSRWQRVVLESCKQSRRLYLPALNAVATPVQIVAAAATRGELILLAHPTGEPLARHYEPLRRATGFTLLVGPEGGFSEEEVGAMVKAGAYPIGLGKGILRVETAAIALLGSVMLHSFEIN